SAADRNAFGALPVLQPQKARDHRSELARISFDHPKHQPSRFEMVRIEEGRDILLREGARRNIGQWIAAAARACLPPLLENRRKCRFVGAIAILLATIAELRAVSIDMDARQHGGTVHRYACLWPFLVFLVVLVALFLSCVRHGAEKTGTPGKGC